jgi:hypothetical protein
VRLGQEKRRRVLEGDEKLRTGGMETGGKREKEIEMETKRGK